ncbi:MAG: tetratricopeptide repeat protein [Thermomicrobiales bacterium]
MLRRFREQAGLSQEELAERAGLTANGIGALERGERQRPYPQTVRALAEALGLSEEERFAFAAAIQRRAGGGGEPAEVAAPSAVPAARVAGLPGSLTELIGREREAGVALRLLLRPDVRLLTLTGPGGVGKTRLGLHVAASAATEFPDGASFVPLAPLADPALVLGAIAQVLGVHNPGRAPLGGLLATALAGRRTLLMLDNFEHLAEAAPEISALLLACPQLKVLVTSQAALRVRGEQEYRVPPLALPTVNGEPDVAALREYAAVRLFTDRATGILPGFALTPENATAVAAICRRLDGLPLAIELAAARVNLLPPAALLARLDHAMPLLAGGARDLPARQRTMRDAIAWSHALLTPEERTLFQRLAVFAGGTTLDAAEAVCAEVGSGKAEVGSALTATFPAPHVLLPTSSILETLGGLVEKSLVVAEGAGGNDEPRYRLLEPVRQYAAEQLAASGAEMGVRDRHAAFFLALGEAAAREEGGPRDGEWLQRLGVEQENLRAALAHFRARGEWRRGATLAGALAHFWNARGQYAEGRRWLAIFLDGEAATPGQELTPQGRVRALFAAGMLAHQQGDDAAARALQEEVLARARALDDRRMVAEALAELGHAAHREGDTAAALASYGESLAIRQAIGDERGVALARDGLGRAALTAGDPEAARAHFLASQERFERLGDRTEGGRALFGLAMVERERGDDGAARGWFERGLARWREVGYEPGVSLVLAYLGDIAARQGELAQARAWLTEGLTLALRQGTRQNIAYGLEGFAALAVAEGQPVRALRLAGSANALRAAIGAPLYPRWQARLDAWLAPAREALGEAAAGEGWEAGMALGDATACEEALGV